MNIRISIILLLFNLLVQASIYGQIQINEVLGHNENIYSDEHGDFHDWIELRNPYAEALNLSGYAISDENEFESAWTLPSIEIPGNGLLVLFAAGSENADTNALHAGFKVNNEGENIFLFNPIGQLIDISPSYEMPINYSLGRNSQNPEEWLLFQNPTPQEINFAHNQVILPIWWEAIGVSHSSGWTSFPLELTVSCSANDVVIRYTLNGTEPTIYSPIWYGALTLSGAESAANVISLIASSDTWQIPSGTFTPAIALRAAAFRNETRVSEVVERTYFNASDEIPTGFYVVSIVTEASGFFSDDEGIYVYGDHEYGNFNQPGVNWQREAHISFFLNQEEVWTGAAGLRTHGRSSRAYPQKTIRIYADHHFDNISFELPLFGETSSHFDRLLLRAPDRIFSSALFADEVTQRLCEPLNLDLMRSHPAIVFINGEYWGVHQIRERLDEAWIKRNHNIEEIDMLDFDRTLMATEGTDEAWKGLTTYMASHNAVEETSFEFLSDRVDISSFMDYIGSQLFFSNIDFPVNNVRMWRPASENGKWRFLFFDCDACMQNVQHFSGVEMAMGNTGEDPASILFRYLLQNESFKNQFLIHTLNNVQTHWGPEKIIPLINEFTSLLQPEINDQIRRWHYPQSVHMWNRDIDELRHFALRRPVEFFDEFGENLVSPFEIFPNPSIDKITISLLNGGSFDPGVIEIKSIQGAAVLREDHTSDITMLHIDISFLEPGMYLMDLNYGSIKFTHRILVQ